MLERLAAEQPLVSCSRISTGPTPRPSTSSPSSRTASRARGSCSSAPTAPRRSVPAIRSTGSRPDSSAPARPRWSSSRSTAEHRGAGPRSAARRCRAELVDAISRRSEGNPLFARELLAAARSRRDRAAARAAGRAAGDVARLDANSRSVLRVAAAAGGRPVRAAGRGDAARRARARRGAARRGRARRARARSGGGRLPLPPRAVRRGGLRDAAARRARGAARALARALTEEPRLAASGATAAEARTIAPRPAGRRRRWRPRCRRRAKPRRSPG